MSSPATASRSLLLFMASEDVHKTVLILGGSYAGLTAARELVQRLPQGWRNVVVDRNAEFNRVCAVWPCLLPA